MSVTASGDTATQDASLTSTDADRELKARHRAMWALGDYAAVAAEIVPSLGPALVSACGIRPGDRVLDVAAGTGNAAIPAARLGARVVASDLTPALLAAGQRAAARAGVELDWQEGDVEALPYGDGAFDTVMSCLGVMFAPHHELAAAEITRVCRPGGTIGLLSWTPEGFIGQMFAAMKPYAPAPPPGAQPPPLWGNEAHVRALLGDRADVTSVQRRTLEVDHFSAPEEFLDYFKTNYGPTVAAFRGIADQPEKVAALDESLRDLAARHGCGTGRSTMRWEYLLLTARTR